MSPLLPTTRYFTPPDGGQMVMPALTRSNGEDSVNHDERMQLAQANMSEDLKTLEKMGLK